MNHADFIHYVRLSEYASTEAPERYRRQVAAFAALGYGWVAACLLSALAVIAWAVPQLMAGRWRGFSIMLLLGATGLAWSSLKALWVRLDDEPDGITLTKADAPALFKLLSKVRRKVNGPRLDEVILNDEFNASITQLPRRGLIGGHVNRLHIGLPLLMALDTPRLTAVLAHEYGHLRGDHGRFAAWIYRTRLSWGRLNEQLAEEDSASSWLTALFMRWYVPRFLARSFALARQDEYEADRIASELISAETAAAALIEIEVKGDWLSRAFWNQHWRMAAHQAQAQGPYRAMKHLLGMPPEEAEAQAALQRALKMPTSFDDTHPSLKDRLEALAVPARLPPWSRHSALGLLGPKAELWMEHFDQQWCRAQAPAWQAQHQRLQALKQRVMARRHQLSTLNAAELVMLAREERRLDDSAPVWSLYEQARQQQSDHADALIGLACHHPHASWQERLGWLDIVWQAGRRKMLPAAQRATALLERHIHEAPQDTLKVWRQRLKQAQAVADTLWDELCTPPWLQGLSRHDLNELELDDTLTTLRRVPAIHRAWLVCKRTPSNPHEPAYLLLLELPALNDGQRYAVCRAVEQRLDLPGPVLALWAGDDPTLKDIEQQAFSPIYRAG